MNAFQFKPVPHEEAARIIAGRPVVSRDVFKRLLPEIRARAFLISGVEDLNVVQQIRDLIAEIPRGGSWEDAKRQIVEHLGPWMDPEAAEKRAILLMRHHGFQAYAAAQHEQMMEQLPVMPYWKYLTMGDERVREAHAALHGLILPASDPFWQTHFPPWDWGCRCQVVPVLESEYQAAVGASRVAGKKAMDYGERTQGWALGPEATKALNHGRLDMGDGMPVDVRAPVQRATTAEERAAAYQWNPGDLRLDLDQLRSRYDAETFALFERRAKNMDIGGCSVWEWLEGKAIPASGVRPVPPIVSANEKAEQERRKSAVQKRREKISSAEYTKKKNLGGGINGSYVLQNGDKVVWKPKEEEHPGLRSGIADGTMYRREIAASIIDEALGFDLVPPTSELKFEGMVGSAQAFSRGSKTAAQLRRGGLLDEALSTIPSIDLERFLTLDEVLYNTDRHSGNYMLRKSGKSYRLVAIDNGLTLPSASGSSMRIPDNPTFHEFRGKKISDDLMKDLQSFRMMEPSLRPVLSGLLEDAAIDNLFDRVDNLIRRGRHVK